MTTIVKAERLERASYHPPDSDIAERESYLRSEFVRTGRALVKKGDPLNKLLREIFKDDCQ